MENFVTHNINHPALLVGNSSRFMGRDGIFVLFSLSIFVSLIVSPVVGIAGIIGILLADLHLLISGIINLILIIS